MNTDLMSGRPLVLVAPSVSTDGTFEYKLNADYVRAIEAAGCCAVVAAGGAQSYIRAAEKCDGVLLSGGPDVLPERYGEERLEGADCTFCPERDDAEFALIDFCVANGYPVLGVCRGLQILNVAFGGTLWQDLALQLGAAHEQYHTVTLTGGELLGTGNAGNIANVNSYHHQAIRKCADGFVATAYSGDGVIEGMEHCSLPISAVQWHPERTVPGGADYGKCDDFSHIFSRFAALCRDKRKNM